MTSSVETSLQKGRRQFLLYSAATLVASTFTPLAHASSNKIPLTESKKLLSFRHLHTNETLQVCYWKDQRFDLDALAKINHILRDHRTHEIAAIDQQLLHLLHRLHEKTNSSAPFEIISGFRSEKTNEALRKSTTGVAKRSYHMQGKAIDVRLADVDLKLLRNTAIELQAGGVGYYSNSGFLHLDTGRPRNW